jgi:hypothetical protein
MMAIAACGLVGVCTLSRLMAGSALAFLPEQMRGLGVLPPLILALVIILLPVGMMRLRQSDWKSDYGLLFLVIATLSAMSFYGFVVLTAAQSPAAYFLTPNRFWEMGMGCLLALAVSGPKPTAPAAPQALAPGRRGLSLAVLTAIIGCFFLPISWKILSIPLIICLTLLLIGNTKANRPASKTVDQILSHPMVVYVGLISYSLYLWHWPLLVLTRWTVSPDPADRDGVLPRGGMPFPPCIMGAKSTGFDRSRPGSPGSRFQLPAGIDPSAEQSPLHRRRQGRAGGPRIPCDQRYHHQHQQLRSVQRCLTAQLLAKPQAWQTLAGDAG